MIKIRAKQRLKNLSKMRRIIKSILLIFLCAFTFTIAINFQLVKYGLQQLKGQLNIVWDAKPLDHYLQDKEFPDSLKQKIQMIQEVKKYAVDELGLNPSDSYGKMYNQEGKPILWIITACEPFSFKAKTWEFPFLGKVTYKGFFNYKLAEKEERELQKKGWETRVRSVSAWSTLGIFDDPVLSNMLLRNEGSIANTIIHELTHGTIYIKDSVAFNENLATFIGDKGAEKFLIEKFGVESPQYIKYQEKEEDKRKFTKVLLKSYKKLDSLYQNKEFKNSTQTKKEETKKDYIQSILSRYKDLKFHNKGYQNYFKENTPNNAFFISFAQYRKDLSFFDTNYNNKFDSNLRNMILYYKNHSTSIF